MENVYNNAVDDFNSHAHVERDAIIHIHIAVNAYFNSHAHVERDAIIHIHIAVNAYFNSHAHVERDSVIFR